METQTSSGCPGNLLKVANAYANGTGSCLNKPQLKAVVTTNDASQTAQTTYTYDIQAGVCCRIFEK